MDKMHRPKLISDGQGKAIHDKLYGSGKKYVPMEVPKFGETVTVHGSKLVLRDDDGSSMFEGDILVERDSGTGHSTVIMSRAMAEEMLGVFFAENNVTVDTIRMAIDNLSKDSLSEPATLKDVFLEAKLIPEDQIRFQEECAAADKEVEEHVRNQARTYADNIFGSMPYKKEYNKDGWMNYLNNISTPHREIARLSFQERMNLLTGKTAQTDNDGNDESS